MSALRPAPIYLQLGCEELELLFTLEAADMIEEKFDIYISGVAEIFRTPENIPYILHCFDRKHTTEERITAAITESNALEAVNACMECLTEGLPKAAELPETGDRDGAGDEALSVSRVVYLAMSELHMAFSEAMAMTLRQVLVIYLERIKMSGKPQSIDDIIPI